MVKRSKAVSVLIYTFLILMTIITIIPIAYTISASFKPNVEIMNGGVNLIPKAPTLDNFITAWTMGSGSGTAGGSNFAHYTWNSLVLSVLSTIGSVLFTSMAAYCFQRGHFPGRKLLYNIFLGTMFIGAGSVTLFPILQISTAMGINNLYGTALVQIFTNSAANLFLTIGYLKTISLEIDDAARIDGCSFFKIYYRIILPLCKPILATIALMAFRYAWNDYLLPMLMTLGKTDQYPLVVAVVQLKSMGGEGAAQYNLMMAGTVFAIVPIVLIYIALNKYFVAGMTAGAVKG